MRVKLAGLNHCAVPLHQRWRWCKGIHKGIRKGISKGIYNAGVGPRVYTRVYARVYTTLALYILVVPALRTLGTTKSCCCVSLLLDMPHSYTSDFAGRSQLTHSTDIEHTKGKGNKDNIIVADNRYRKDKQRISPKGEVKILLEVCS